LVLATDNVDPIADGSILYTCTVDVAGSARAASWIAVRNLLLSDPAGHLVPDASGCDGSVGPGSVAPTPTGYASPTRVLTPTNAPTGVLTPVNTPTPVEPPPCAPPMIGLGYVNAPAGAKTSISATLYSGSAMVAGTQNDFAWDTSLVTI